MVVNLCIPTFNRPDLLGRAVEAALLSDVPVQVVVLDLSPAQYASGVLGDAPVRLIALPENPGLAGAWNLCYAMYDDLLVIANDDVVVHRHTVRELVESAEDFAEDVLFFGAHSPWSLFLLRKHAYLQAGPFDPAFWPLYYDDCDMQYRLKLLGYGPTTATAATFDHLHGGSASLQAYSAAETARHHARFRRNQRYYIAKWGGDRGEETFTRPFDGGPAWVPPLIKE